MSAASDAELLRHYAASHSEEAFAELVQRHLSFVYNVALRRVGGDTHRAEDIAQTVFADLARKAGALSQHTALTGWLHTSTRYAAAEVIRREQRRQNREQEASAMTASAPDPGAELAWENIRPHIDEALDQLNERDRAAVLLRFFQNQPLRQIGETLAVSEDAARKRIDRALEKLRRALAQRGIVSTGAALSLALANNVALAAPATLATSITATAAASAASSTATSGLIYFMNTKLALSTAATVGLAGLLCLSSVSIAVYEVHENTNSEATAAVARRENKALEENLSRLFKQIRDTEQTLATKTAATQSAAPGASAKSSPPAAAPKLSESDAERLRDGQEFIARFPEAAPLLREISRPQVHSNYLSFYRLANLTPAQIDELETKTVEYLLKNQTVGPNYITPLVDRLPDTELQQLLGPETFERFQDFIRARPAYALGRWAAMCAGFTSIPLSITQADQIAQAVINNSSDYLSGQTLKFGNVNWPAAREQIQRSVAPDQWKAIQPALLEFEYRGAVEKARQ
ncbi:MAG: sigma-70 family RNA polymerase sigma factor [Nibricoccus sp.]